MPKILIDQKNLPPRRLLSGEVLYISITNATCLTLILTVFPRFFLCSPFRLDSSKHIKTSCCRCRVMVMGIEVGWMDFALRFPFSCLFSHRKNSISLRKRRREKKFHWLTKTIVEQLEAASSEFMKSTPIKFNWFLLVYVLIAAKRDLAI
jgi:hypothetical protein